MVMPAVRENPTYPPPKPPTPLTETPRPSGGARAAVVLNAAAALYVADRAASLREGVAMAESILDSGSAWEQLERLREASHRE